MFVMKDNLFYKLFNGRVIIYLLVMIILLFIAAAIKDVYRQRDLRGSLKSINQELSNLEKEKGDLNNLLNYVNSNDFVEETARTKLNMRKPGEKVIILSNTAEVQDLMPMRDNSSTTSEPQRTNYQKWVAYFFEH